MIIKDDKIIVTHDMGGTNPIGITYEPDSNKFILSWSGGMKGSAGQVGECKLHVYEADRFVRELMRVSEASAMTALEGEIVPRCPFDEYFTPVSAEELRMLENAREKFEYFSEIK